MRLLPSRLRRGVPAAVLSTAVFAALASSLVLAPAPSAEAAAPPYLSFPAPEGTQWAVLSGYNTATHSEADANDPYAIDLHRTDGPTAGTPVLAPISGTVRYSSSSCLSIRDDAGNSVMMCHIFAPSSLRGQTVTRGQRIGAVAPDGEANNNGVAHIHLAISSSSRAPAPFVGAYALEGVALPATTEPGAYTSTAFRSTNREIAMVDAGADLTVRPNTSVALAATVTGPGSASGRVFAWTQVSGTRVALASNGASASFTAPSRTGTLQFRVAVVDGTSEAITDTVSVRVSNSTPASTSTPAPVATSTPGAGGFVASPTFSAAGQALAVFSGGSIDQLEAAARASGATGVWAQDASGTYQLLILSGPSFLRDAFVTRFPAFSGPTAVTLVR